MKESDLQQSVCFEIPGKCIAKQRARKGKGGNFYTPQPTREYETEVAWQAKIAKKHRKPFTCAVSVDILIHEPIPPSWPPSQRKRALAREILPKKNDLDNKIKSLNDGMNGILYLDDKQVAKITAEHFYSETPKAIITVKPYDARKEQKPNGKNL